MTSIFSRLAPHLLAQGAAGAEPHGWWDVVRHDVIPVAAAYAVFVALLTTYRRATQGPNQESSRADASHPRPLGNGSTGTSPSWGDLVRYTVGTAVGGYVFFLAIVFVFYFVLGGEDWGFIRDALVEGSLMTFALVVPAFLLLSWIQERRSNPRKT